jgi:hypothetical protein
MMEFFDFISHAQRVIRYYVSFEKVIDHSRRWKRGGMFPNAIIRWETWTC